MLELKRIKIYDHSCQPVSSVYANNVKAEQRKPGEHRKTDPAARVLSVISGHNHKKWFQSIWTDIAGASTRDHPAPFPVELAAHLVRMFLVAGDTVLDPFAGTGTTAVAAAKWGRNSINVEINPHYYKMAAARIRRTTNSLFSHARLVTQAENKSALTMRNRLPKRCNWEYKKRGPISPSYPGDLSLFEFLR